VAVEVEGVVTVGDAGAEVAEGVATGAIAVATAVSANPVGKYKYAN
jgi:hypothetical protein